MKVLLQRVSRAEVRVAGESVGKIGAGLLVFLGVERGDERAVIPRYASRLAELRVFPDREGKMNCSIKEVQGSILLVSQFTLAASTRKGRRPSYSNAAEPALAEQLYEAFAAELVALGLALETGRFGALMEVELINDGPVTILLDPSSGAAS